MMGLFLIIIGAIFLLKNLGLISGSMWDMLWPALLIVFGLNILLRRKGAGFFCGERFGWRRKEIREDK